MNDASNCSGDSPAKPRFDFNRRASGVLLHITSLPGPHGSGDLGTGAHRFVDFLSEAGQSWWQVLPTGPAGRAPAFSPYDSPSTFAANPWFVSLETLAEQGLLEPDEVKPIAGLSSRRVNFSLMVRFRRVRLRRAFERFHRRAGERNQQFRNFCERNADWLDDAALFEALREYYRGKSWTDWESGVRRREPTASRAACERLATEVEEYRFVQFEFDRQWRALREYARQRGIGLIGDLPMFVAHDSADVWSNPHLFQLNRKGLPRRVSGYPPDRFNPNGQRWGHPQYEWPRHEQTDFAWWVRRMGRMFDLFDGVRIDHFLGFTRTWSIPGSAPSARDGRWVRSPGFKLLHAMEKSLGRRPMIAEDLGHVTPGDVRLRDAFGLPPMRIFQFGFGGEADSADHLPSRYGELCAAYTGNHDTDTIVGWLRHLPTAQRRRVLKYLGSSSTSLPHLAAIRTLMESNANLVIFPIQDILGLDSRARMNVPGTIKGNWRWRLPATKLDSVAPEIRQLVKSSQRK